MALLTEHDASLQGGADERRAERRMLEEIDTLWRTAPLRAEKPTPVDEVRAIMAVFDETLYTAVPHVYRRVDDDFLDPSAFRKDSTLGCAGLLDADSPEQCARREAVEETGSSEVRERSEVWRLNSTMSWSGSTAIPSG